METTKTTTTTTTTNSTDDSALLHRQQEELASLDHRRNALEQEAQGITSKLLSPTGDNGTGRPIGIDTPLVDVDGYPRADIDLYLARTLRGRLAEIRTDLRQLMAEMEQLLSSRPFESTTTSSSQPQQQPAAAKVRNEQQARLATKPKPKYDPVTGKWVVKNWDGTIAGAGANHDGVRTFDSIEDTVVMPPLGGLSTMTLQHQEQQSTTTRTNNNTTLDTHMTEASGPSESTTTASSSSSLSLANLVANCKPLAKVNAVAPHSPAAEAGLMEDDLILQFGTISVPKNNNDNHDEHDAAAAAAFAQVAELVPMVAGQQDKIVLVIQRPVSNNDNNNEDDDNQQPSSLHSLELVPRPWNGRGLLGCHIVPIL